MKIEKLLEKATAAEVTLIEAVTKQMHQEILDRVLTEFELNLRKRFDFNARHIHKEDLIAAIEQTVKEIKKLTA